VGLPPSIGDGRDHVTSNALTGAKESLSLQASIEERFLVLLGKKELGVFIPQSAKT
jgi:hypothetical protein